MSYTLLIGQRTYSSWSLRGWLPFAVHDIPVEVKDTLIYGDNFYPDVAAFGGHRSVPVVKTPSGNMLTDSLAIGLYLADAHPDRGMLPSDSGDLAVALSMLSEMHSGFPALRGACPMNLATGWAGFVPDEATIRDLNRIDTLWTAALERSDGPFLFGDYGLVDAHFAPVAIRIAGYGLPVSDRALAYVSDQLNRPEIRQWREDGLAKDAELSQYDMDLERVPFPMPDLPTAD